MTVRVANIPRQRLSSRSVFPISRGVVDGHECVGSVKPCHRRANLCQYVHPCQSPSHHVLDENGSLSFAFCIGVDFAWTRVRTVSPQVSVESLCQTDTAGVPVERAGPDFVVPLSKGTGADLCHVSRASTPPLMYPSNPLIRALNRFISCGQVW